jgi:anti-sigma regulatory factor (Ser/Thr protein kinase)
LAHPPHAGASAGFRHEALLDAGDEDFVVQTGAFVQDGLATGEDVLVIVGARKIDLLREHLGPDADRVLFADMAEAGRNPAWIIPAWRDFVADHAAAGRRFRGVGEPVDPERDPDSLLECQRHEALLNVAFQDSTEWSLLCPYDTDALPAGVIEEALRTHPYVANGDSATSPAFIGLERCAAPFRTPLPPVPGTAWRARFTVREIQALRGHVERFARSLEASARLTEDLVLVVHELTSNSVTHGGGAGTLELWHDAPFVVAQISDDGVIADPLAGRTRPPARDGDGRGLWLATRLSDLLQIRSTPEGGVVRVRMRLP